MSTETVSEATRVVPPLLYDGGSIDVLFDYHDQAAQWYKSHLGWEIRQQENWKPDPRVSQGKMTHMGWGTWLSSHITAKRLPHHYAERGTVDPNVRWCWRVRDLAAARDRFKENAIRVTDIYRGPGGHDYFDFWATFEGTRLTAQGDAALTSDAFEPSWTRIGVSDLQRAVSWYQAYVGMELESEHRDDGYVLMRLGLNHHPGEHSLWVLEQLPEGTYSGKVDGAVRPSCWIANRESFFEYQRYLASTGVETSDIGGFTTKGLVSFHFYDPDGNRFNVSSM